MRSLDEIVRANEANALDASYDKTRPVLERVNIWQTTDDRDFSHALELLCELAEYCEQLESWIESARTDLWMEPEQSFQEGVESVHFMILGLREENRLLQERTGHASDSD